MPKELTVNNLTKEVSNLNTKTGLIRKNIPKLSKEINNSTIILYFFVFVFAIAIMLISFDALAADDVFAKVNTKGTEIVKGLKNIAIVIATIAIMIVAFMMYKGRIGNQMAFGIIIGSIILGAAPEIADLLIN